MAWRRSDDKPLFESIMVKVTDPYELVVILNELVVLSDVSHTCYQFKIFMVYNLFITLDDPTQPL